MAPKKEKVEKVSANAQEDAVFQYLRKQNRPYSATDISANLHNKVTKSAAAKILIKLQEAKKIEGRASGKQSVYHAVQNADDAPTTEQLAVMTARTETLRSETSGLNAKVKQLRTQLAQLTSSLTTSDLRTEVARFQAEKTDITTRLVSLRSGSVRPVSKEEREGVEKELRSVEKCVLARRGIVKEMWGIIAEAVPKSESHALREDLGVDV